MFFKTSNGISQIPDYKITRKKKQLVFTNRPERGMGTLLLQIMPKIWEKDIDRDWETLIVFSFS